MYFYLGEYAAGIDYAKESLEISEKAGNMIDVADTLNSLGKNYFKLKESRLAESYFRRSLQIYQELKMEPDIYMSKHNIILLLITNRNYQDALADIEESIDECKKSNNKSHLLSYNYLKSHTLRCQGELIKAKQILESSLDLYNEIAEKTVTDTENFAHCLFSLILVNIELEIDQYDVLLDKLVSIGDISSTTQNLLIMAESTISFHNYGDNNSIKDRLLDIINSERVYIASFALQLFYEIISIDLNNKASDLDYIKDLLNHLIEYSDKHHLVQLELQFTSLLYRVAVIENNDADQIQYLNRIEQLVEEYDLHEFRKDLELEEKRSRTEILKNIITVSTQNYFLVQVLPKRPDNSSKNNVI